MKTQSPGKAVLVSVVALGVGAHALTTYREQNEAWINSPNSYGHPETPKAPTAPRQMTLVALSTGTGSATTGQDLEALTASFLHRPGR